MNGILHISDVHCGYNARPVLNGITFSLKQGETVLVAGPNGCGKSTLLKAIIGMLPLTEGVISFDGTDFKHISTERRINMGIGYLSQTDNIFPGLTVKENLELSGLSIQSKSLEKAIGSVLAIFDFLKPLLNRRAGVLSGGQRQALAIAMVLLHPRKLYLLDEPTAGLSPKAADDIITRIHQFTKTNSQCTVLMVEHRLELLNWIDRAIILIQGRIQAEANDTSLLQNAEWMSKHYF